ncbi:MAG: c-type cytochrome [Myxococcales bacterium]|nr:c-type cytochrome [Myxococcales bacterium]
MGINARRWSFAKRAAVAATFICAATSLVWLPGANQARAAAPSPPPIAGKLAPEPPIAAPQGLMAAWQALGIDLMARSWRSLWNAPRPGELGGPSTAAPWRLLLDFYDGRTAFEHVFTEAEGLGPTYNDNSCAACHLHPTIGGGGADMKQGIFVHGPKWTGGDAMGLRKHAIAGFAKEQAAGKVGRLRTPPLFGLGLLDLVPESARAALEDPNDKNGDGIKGVRAYRHGGGERRPSRFGQKANDWDLRHFAAGAMVDEMGLTNTVRRDPRADRDKHKDPEVPRAFVMRIEAFVRNLAPPARGPITPQVTRGAAVFARLNCTGCHRPQLGKVSGAYTDLLIHDMGPGLDSGLKDGVATGAQWRTAPLWGLRHRARYLHDERAPTIDAALAMHQGEATAPATAYRQLNKADKAALLGFLRSL